MGDQISALRTPRLRLVPATPVLIAAELQSADRLAELLDALLPADWPPEHHDVETLRFWREQLAQPGSAGWWVHYALLSAAERCTLVGTASYKGPSGRRGRRDRLLGGAVVAGPWAGHRGQPRADRGSVEPRRRRRGGAHASTSEAVDQGSPQVAIRSLRVHRVRSPCVRTTTRLAPKAGLSGATNCTFSTWPERSLTASAWSPKESPGSINP